MRPPGWFRRPSRCVLGKPADLRPERRPRTGFEGDVELGHGGTLRWSGELTKGDGLTSAEAEPVSPDMVPPALSRPSQTGKLTRDALDTRRGEG